MGALILLLLVTTRRIRSNVIQQSRVAQLETTEQTSDALDLELSLQPTAAVPSDSLQPETPDRIEPVEPPRLLLPEPAAEPIVVDVTEELVPLAFVDLLESQLAPEKLLPPATPPKPIVDPNIELREVIAQLEKQRERIQRQM